MGTSKELKISGLTDAEIKELFPHHPILIGYVGSIAHNMYMPKNAPNSIDDRDIMGVEIGPRSMYLGLKHYEGTNKFIREWDSVSYELKKYVRLLLKSNPNVLSLLWLEESQYLYITQVGKLLIANRDLFASKKIYHSFTGYAHGQLKRMKSDTKMGYMGEKRAALVKEFGYDTKNAAHCIRLLRMGIEFLNTGKLKVARDDRDELLSIKRGEWTIEQVQTEAESLFTWASIANKNSTLPEEPDYDTAESLVMGMLWDHWF